MRSVCSGRPATETNNTVSTSIRRSVIGIVMIDYSLVAYERQSPQSLSVYTCAMQREASRGDAMQPVPTELPDTHLQPPGLVPVRQSKQPSSVFSKFENIPMEPYEVCVFSDGPFQ
ncbi:hypothetical protein T265_15646, partial [Opisthorchis viverrini]